MDSRNREIPDIIIARMPWYLRALCVLREKGETTNSKELGEFLGYSAAQIRKDLSQFGEFGKQGTGYNIDFLTGQIKSILNIDRKWEIVLVGCGNIGHAILNYPGFTANGFSVAAAFDSDPKLIGQKINDRIVIMDISRIEEVLKERDLSIAMLTVPASAAQATAEKLVECGIKGILTYAPMILNLPDHIRVEYLDPVISLQHITYYMEA